MSDKEDASALTISDLFPNSSKVLLTGGGKEFIERIGVEATRRVVLSVMMGENIRTRTEPLTRRRIAQISGAMVALFARGWLEIEHFTEQLSEMALREIQSARKNDTATIWPAQWLVGLTGKSVQNVLRSDPDRMREYLTDFEQAVKDAAEKSRADMGNISMTLGFAEDESGERAELTWNDIARLTTAIGSQTLTIRGSDKSIYGKLFERLVLGSMLTIFGFQRVNPILNRKTERVFWLSDSSENRESDATILLRSGKLARFDIGFIGPGNSEISKDKLNRYTNEMKAAGGMHSSVTFIVVDRLPETSKTMDAAAKIGAEIVQMSMQYWPRELAQRLGRRIGFRHELQDMPDAQIEAYLAMKLEAIPVQDFLTGVSLDKLEAEADLPGADEELEDIEAED